MVRIREILDPELKQKVLDAARPPTRMSSPRPFPNGSSWMMPTSWICWNDLKEEPEDGPDDPRA